MTRSTSGFADMSDLTVTSAILAINQSPINNRVDNLAIIQTCLTVDNISCWPTKIS